MPFISTLAAILPVDTHQEKISIQRIPAELWLQIFTLGKRLDDTHLFTTTIPQNGQIDSVSAVVRTCSYFRKLAIGSPVLWTSIHIDDTCGVSNILRCIERSRQLTLDIGIDLLGGGNASHASDVEAVMDALVQEIGRWRSLRIRLGVEQIGCPVVMRLRDHQALNLEYLSISVNSRERGDTPPAPHILNYGAPRLISAKLRGVAHTFYRPPISNLTTLRLEGIGHLKMDFISFVGVLTQATRLRHLLIRRDIVNADVWALQSPESLSLKELRSLHIYSESGAMYAGFLLAMDAPQLSALTLEGVFDRDLDPLWTRAAPQKFASLSHLMFITEDDISSTTYVKACSLFPNITEYTSQRSTPSNSQIITILSGKRQQLNGEPFIGWPKLQTLRLALDPSAESMEYIQQVTDGRINCRRSLGQVCFFRSKNGGWMSEADWSIRLKTPVRFEGHLEVLPGDGNYIDVDDIVE